MILKRLLKICENKGCYGRITNNVIYLRSEDGNGLPKNIKICAKCFKKTLEEEGM